MPTAYINYFSFQQTVGPRTLKVYWREKKIISTIKTKPHQVGHVHHMFKFFWKIYSFWKKAFFCTSLFNITSRTFNELFGSERSLSSDTNVPLKKNSFDELKRKRNKLSWCSFFSRISQHKNIFSFMARTHPQSLRQEIHADYGVLKLHLFSQNNKTLKWITWHKVVQKYPTTQMTEQNEIKQVCRFMW